MITERDYYNMLNTAKADGLAAGLAEGEAKGLAAGLAEGEAKGRAEGIAEGREEGLVEGRAEGRNEEKIRIAKTLRGQGVAASIIAFATGLSEAQIAEL